MVMPSNNSSGVVHYLAGKYPGSVGWLLGPSSWKDPRPYLPYALDNDAYTAWTQRKPWDEAAWLTMLKKARKAVRQPLWCLVPDVVADRTATLENWKRYVGVVLDFGFEPAFAAQDGMTASDIPEESKVVFIGGTTEWKWKSLATWAATGRRIHVGRVNEVNRLNSCQRLKVESVDGSGWFRGTMNGRQASGLIDWIENGNRQSELSLL